MTAHHQLCDGWHYVGKGNLPNPGDDSVPCTGQCVERLTGVPSEHLAEWLAGEWRTEAEARGNGDPLFDEDSSEYGRPETGAW
jgi:hypothetical protein